MNTRVLNIIMLSHFMASLVKIKSYTGLSGLALKISFDGTHPEMIGYGVKYHQAKFGTFITK